MAPLLRDSSGISGHTGGPCQLRKLFALIRPAHSPHEMLLDLVNRMLSEVLTDFSDDPTLHVGVEGVLQIRQCARWCDDDERLHLPLAHELFHRRGYALSEAVLLEVMPVGRLHAASFVCTCALEYAAWTVGTLLAGWRVFVNEDTLGLEIGKFLVAVVAQEQRLAAIADEHEGIMRNLQLAHGGSSASD